MEETAGRAIETTSTCLRLDKDLHRKLKAYAALNDTTMTQLLLEGVAYIKDEVQ